MPKENNTREQGSANPESFAAVVEARRAARGFLPDPVSEATLEEVVRLATHAPSNCNTQPWKVYIVSGDRRDKLAARILAEAAAGRVEPDFPYDGRYEGVYQERQHQAAARLYDAMGIERGDAARRSEAFMRNFRFFDAPHVAFFFLPEPFGLREAADLGMCAQTFMLALAAHGLASCPQTALSLHPRIVRDAVGAPESEKLLFGISFGFEDPSAPANRARVGRAPVEQIFRFIA